MEGIKTIFKQEHPHQKTVLTPRVLLDEIKIWIEGDEEIPEYYDDETNFSSLDPQDNSHPWKLVVRFASNGRNFSCYLSLFLYDYVKAEHDSIAFGNGKVDC